MNKNNRIHLPPLLHCKLPPKPRKCIADTVSEKTCPSIGKVTLPPLDIPVTNSIFVSGIEGCYHSDLNGIYDEVALEGCICYTNRENCNIILKHNGTDDCWQIQLINSMPDPISLAYICQNSANPETVESSNLGARVLNSDRSYVECRGVNISSLAIKTATTLLKKRMHLKRCKGSIIDKSTNFVNEVQNVVAGKQEISVNGDEVLSVPVQQSVEIKGGSDIKLNASVNVDAEIVSPLQEHNRSISHKSNDLITEKVNVDIQRDVHVDDGFEDASVPEDSALSSYYSPVISYPVLDPRSCVEFDSLDRDKINKHFNNFRSFDFIDGTISKIGSSSKNGLVKKIKFTRQNYSAFAVLKSSATPTSDNLVYEYLAGQFINTLCNYLPTFVETYGLVYYKDDAEWEKSKEQGETDARDFVAGLELQDMTTVDYTRACQDSPKAAVLLQYVEVRSELDKFVSGSIKYCAYQMIYQMPYLLYQVYFALAQTKHQFTHYDLHTSNVLLYEPENGKFIEYVYHLSDTETVRFKCPYIVKIIDYGRCFFKCPTEGSHVSSVDVYKHLCTSIAKDGETNKCKLFRQYGFNYLDDPTMRAKSRHFISSSRSNVSHDLRLLYIISQTFLRRKLHEFNMKNAEDDLAKGVSERVNNLLQKVVYAVGLGKNVSHAGTKENRNSGLPDHINNVSDAEKALRDLVKCRELRKLNNLKYPDRKKCLGTLHIYSNGKPMSFEREAAT